MPRQILLAALFVAAVSQDLFLQAAPSKSSKTQCSDSDSQCLFTKAWQEIAADGSQQAAPPTPRQKPAVGYFLRNMSANAGFSLNVQAPSWLQGQTIYRIAPGNFPEYMHYHYDGLSNPMKFTFGADGTLTMKSKPFQSQVLKNLSACDFMIMAGTGPYINMHGTLPPPFTQCMINPAVNPFPYNGQLWLTIDQAFWGRVDPETLDTIPDSAVQVDSAVLTAHPACDTTTNECFTNYPCKAKGDPTVLSSMYSDEICIGKFVTNGLKNMSVIEVSRAKLPSRMFVHHSHQPCMSKHFIVVKLDHFGLKTPNMKNHGMLRFVNQVENNLWLVYDRRTQESRIMDSGDFKFINNHMLNCREVGDDIIVDTSPSTSKYLNNYFEYALHEEDREWDTIMMPARRCKIPTDPKATSFTCETLITSGDFHGLFDFPTFNPIYKSDPASRWWYGTAPLDRTAKWMNSIIKGDNMERKIVAQWSMPNVYTTEAQFIPRPGATQEDDGVLFSLMYDASIDQSLVVLLDAKTLKTISETPIGFVIPYHSHGVLCNAAGKCYPNP